MFIASLQKHTHTHAYMYEFRDLLFIHSRLGILTRKKKNTKLALTHSFTHLVLWSGVVKNDKKRIVMCGWWSIEGKSNNLVSLAEWKWGWKKKLQQRKSMEIYS